MYQFLIDWPLVAVAYIDYVHEPMKEWRVELTEPEITERLDAGEFPDHTDQSGVGVSPIYYTPQHLLRIVGALLAERVEFDVGPEWRFIEMDGNVMRYSLPFGWKPSQLEL